MVRARDQRGQTAAELVGMLLLVSLIVAAMWASGTAEAIASETSRLVCRIAGGDCADPAGPSAPGRSPADGPSLWDHPLPVLPFPGTSVSVTCTYAPGGDTCRAPEGGGVGVQAEGELSIERGDTALDDEGCPQQALSVTTSLELAATAGAEGATASGSLEAHLGHATTYQVSVPPDEADRLEDGDRATPNPVDPRTIRAGESVQLSEEYYAGVGLDAQYRAIQARFGYDEGRRVSSGVERVSPTTVRVMVGDEDFVRQALALGLGNESLGVSVGGNEELSSGRLDAVDIDISTREGWDAYQAFVETGELPGRGTAGTLDPTTAQTIDYSDETVLEGRFGEVTLGGTLGDSEGHATFTEHEDGTVDVVRHARYDDVGLAIRETQDADGARIGNASYSLLLEGVDESFTGGLQDLDGSDAELRDGTLRIDLGADDLEELQHLARERLADRVEENGDGRPTAEEIGESLADGDGIVEWEGAEADFGAPFSELAGAKTPEEMLVALYRMRPDPNAIAQELQSMLLHAGAELPGEIVAPDCG